eukprot:6491290-Amphidinium_carterae.1
MTSEECLVSSTQAECCSQDAVIQRAMERVQVRADMMWHIRKRWTETETMTNREVKLNDRDDGSEKKSE